MIYKIRHITAALSRFMLGGIALLAAFALCFLFVSGMLGTADMSTDNPMQELILFSSDSLIRNLLCLILMIVLGITILLYIRSHIRLEKLKPWVLSLSIAGWVVVLGSLWVAMSLSLPTHDSLIVTRAGVAAANGDMSFLNADYFIRFPFQLGYVFWTELWARLLSLTHSDYIAMEIINVLCLASGEAALVMVTEKLFRRREITLAVTLTLAFFFQPVIFSTFLYGTIPGFCFAAWSVFFFLRYLETDKFRHMLPAALLLALSVSLKLNNMILLAAMAIILLTRLMKEKPLRRALSLILLCVTVLTLPTLSKWQYQLRMDKDFGEGIPMISWMAMGLHDATSAPGWYNGSFTVVNFHDHNCDPDAAADASREVIAERLEYLAEHPGEASVFFRDKILSQWNEPTYQSIWNNQVRAQSGDKWGIASYVCGAGEAGVTAFMDYGVQFIFCGMLIAAVSLLISQFRKEPTCRSDESGLFLIPLLFLGGFLYHALFEAKSQYVITYVTFMIPYAIMGFAKACETGKTVWAWLRAKKPRATLSR